jgi:AcrR family transcriptional regulator
MSTIRGKRRGAYHHGDLRQALVSAALRTLQRQPVEELSLRAIGRELGVSPRAPYRHFETKEELLAAVAVEGFRAFGAAVTKRLAGATSDPIRRLRAVAEAYVLFAVEQPAAFKVMYAPYAVVNEHAPELLRARAEAHHASQSIILDGQTAGVLRAGDPMELALSLWASMHGLAVLLTEGQLGRFDRPVDAAGVTGLVVEGLLDGLRPRAAAGSADRPGADAVRPAGVIRPPARRP